MNDVTIFEQSQAPAHLQNSERAAEMNKGAIVGTGGGAGVNRISLKQSKFRIIEDGEEVQVLHVGAIDVAVLRVNDGITKTYYENAWNPSQEAEAPTCYSDDGVVPSPNADKPQARTCAECPHNAWGSKINPHTKAESKECSDAKAMAVVAADNVGKNKVYRLSVPAMSLKDWGKHVKQLSSVSPTIPYNAVVTRVAFDTDATYPKLKFSPVRYLTTPEYNAAEERFEEPSTKLAAGLVEAAAASARQRAGTDLPGANPAAAAQQAVRDQGAAQAEAQAQADAQAAKEREQAQMAAQAKAQQAQAQEQETLDAAGGFGSPEAPAPETQQQAKAREPEPAQQEQAVSGFGSEPEPQAQRQAAPAQEDAASGFGSTPEPEPAQQEQAVSGFGGEPEPEQQAGGVVDQRPEQDAQEREQTPKARDLDSVFGGDW